MRRRNPHNGSRKSAKIISYGTIFTKILTEPHHNPETINPSELQYAMRRTARSTEWLQRWKCLYFVDIVPLAPHRVSPKLINWSTITYLWFPIPPVSSLLVYSVVQKNLISVQDDHFLPHSLIQWTKDRRENIFFCTTLTSEERESCSPTQRSARNGHAKRVLYISCCANGLFDERASGSWVSLWSDKAKLS